MTGLRKAGVAGGTIALLFTHGHPLEGAVVCCFYLVVNVLTKMLFPRRDNDAR